MLFDFYYALSLQDGCGVWNLALCVLYQFDLPSAVDFRSRNISSRNHRCLDSNVLRCWSVSRPLARLREGKAVLRHSLYVSIPDWIREGFVHRLMINPDTRNLDSSPQSCRVSSRNSPHSVLTNLPSLFAIREKFCCAIQIERFSVVELLTFWLCLCLNLCDGWRGVGVSAWRRRYPQKVDDHSVCILVSSAISTL